MSCLVQIRTWLQVLVEVEYSISLHFSGQWKSGSLNCGFVFGNRLDIILGFGVGDVLWLLISIGSLPIYIPILGIIIIFRFPFGSIYCPNSVFITILLCFSLGSISYSLFLTCFWISESVIVFSNYCVLVSKYVFISEFYFLKQFESPMSFLYTWKNSSKFGQIFSKVSFLFL